VIKGIFDAKSVSDVALNARLLTSAGVGVRSGPLHYTSYVASDAICSQSLSSRTPYRTRGAYGATETAAGALIRLGLGSGL
jgi:hypothetical protein